MPLASPLSVIKDAVRDAPGRWDKKGGFAGWFFTHNDIDGSKSNAVSNARALNAVGDKRADFFLLVTKLAPGDLALIPKPRLHHS